MTQEEKQLLLKDLCARLPYGVMMKVSHLSHPIALDEFILFTIKTSNKEGIQGTPYLRPLSSMTMEEQREYIPVGRGMSPDNPSVLADWLNAHHFDYRGLIPMGLALEAPKDMYKTE
jgi:hypothetical protein